MLRSDGVDADAVRCSFPRHPARQTHKSAARLMTNAWNSEPRTARPCLTYPCLASIMTPTYTHDCAYAPVDHLSLSTAIVHSECTVFGGCMVIRYAPRVFGGAETSWLQPHKEEEQCR